MSELVERLRRGADDASLDCYAMCEEAADRIEALEAALRQIENICHDPDTGAAAMATIAVARAALEPEK